jgi:tetratricopeptide (TPR) repeat protein
VDPSNVELSCDLLDEIVLLGQFEKAYNIIDQLPAEACNAIGILFRKAQIGIVTGRYSESIQILEKLISESNEGIALWHDLAFAKLCIGQIDSAIQILNTAESKFGWNIDLTIALSRAALLQSNYPQALMLINQVLDIDNGHATALGVRALILLDSDDLSDASKAASDSLLIDPNQHEALIVAGTLALWEQQSEHALNLFNRAITKFPGSGRALSGLGQSLMLINELAQASHTLQNAVIAMPNHIGTWHALAWAQLLQSDIDSAEGCYIKAYEIDRNFADTHGGLALIYALRGQKDIAEQSLKRAFKLNSNCATALYAKSILMSDEGNEIEAERLIANLILSSPALKNIKPSDFVSNLRRKIQPNKV